MTALSGSVRPTRKLFLSPPLPVISATWLSPSRRSSVPAAVCWHRGEKQGSQVQGRNIIIVLKAASLFFLHLFAACVFLTCRRSQGHRIWRINAEVIFDLRKGERLRLPKTTRGGISGDGIERILRFFRFYEAPLSPFIVSGSVFHQRGWDVCGDYFFLFFSSSEKVEHKAGVAQP